MTDKLVQVREFLSNPEHWTRGSSARNRQGLPVVVHSPEAVSFCLLGALDKFGCEYRDFRRVYEETLKASGGIQLTSRFNDERSHADVLQLLDTLIAEDVYHAG